MSILDEFPKDWACALADELGMHQDKLDLLWALLEKERKTHTVYPAKEDVFRAFFLTRCLDVNVVILGQDPYANENQAHGLCFSVQKGVPVPASLRNIFKELSSDMGIPIPNHGCLDGWAKQGVLLLNTILTVRAKTPLSHSMYGWDVVTDAVIRFLGKKTSPVIFVLWGQHAQSKAALIEESHHLILMAPHPSPLSAYRGFFGSRPFSSINQALIQSNKRAIDWG